MNRERLVLLGVSSHSSLAGFFGAASFASRLENEMLSERLLIRSSVTVSSSFPISRVVRVRFSAFVFLGCFFAHLFRVLVRPYSHTLLNLLNALGIVRMNVFLFLWCRAHAQPRPRSSRLAVNFRTFAAIVSSEKVTESPTLKSLD